MNPNGMTLEPSSEIKLVAESFGFGPGYERTYKAYAVYVLGVDGSMFISGSRTDRYFKKRDFAQKEADRLNRMYCLRWDSSRNCYARVDPKCWAFVKEIEVTEKVMY